MTCLDDIKKVFTYEVENGRGDAEAEDATPHASGRGIVSDMTYAVAYARTRACDDHETKGDAEIDEEPENEKGRSLHHQSNDLAEVEIFHSRTFLLKGFHSLAIRQRR